MVNDSAFSESRLSTLLAEADLAYTPDALDDVLRGVLAAPQDHDPDAWLALIGAERDGDLAVALKARKAALADRMPPAHSDPAARLTALRAALVKRGLDGFVIPHADEYLNEYLPPCAERLAWLTGFDGSAGQAVVTRNKAAIFVDGRYTLQAQAQVPATLYDHRHLTDDPLEHWVKGVLAAGSRFGFDPRLHTPAWAERLESTLRSSGITLVACQDNPIDSLWTDRPPTPLSPLTVHPQRFAGRSAVDKLGEIAGSLQRRGYDAAVLTAPESTAWLLNLRGGDVEAAPLPLARAIVHNDDTATLFVDSRAVTPPVRGALPATVRLADHARFSDALESLGRGRARVLVDTLTASAWIVERLKNAGARVDRDIDPCALPRARKNAVELDGARAAHRRDGKAMVRFLNWLASAALTGTVSESTAAARLLALRAEGECFRGVSFETIAGAGPNGAIVHYHVTPQTDRRLEAGSLFLLDSGAQYRDGTTDVTRTLAIGAPSEEMRRRYTLVLKGHIALATLRFPAGTTGSQIDCIARAPLWAEGLDYDHGTGHGVGSYMSVHEGPQRISKVHNTVALEPGMILSDEPGVYVTGAYGIRIENLVAVREAPTAADSRSFLEFETLTLVPYDRSLIETSLLTPAERAWIDTYHRRVADELMPLLDSPAAHWLGTATRPLDLTKK